MYLCRSLGDTDVTTPSKASLKCATLMGGIASMLIRDRSPLLWRATSRTGGEGEGNKHTISIYELLVVTTIDHMDG